MTPGSYTLDLGCGKEPVPEADIRLDLHKVAPANIFGSLDVGEDVQHLPFQDDIASEVYLRHTLEHLSNINRVLAELCRVTRPGGMIHIHVPYYNSLNSAADPTHKPIAHQMTEHTFSYYDNNVLSYETGEINVKVTDVTLIYRDRGLLQRLLPTFLKRMLRHEIGNLVEEMRIDLEVVK